MSRPKIIRESELLAVPWRNGGGVTREIAAQRQGEAIVWRLSMADVESDGPFSRFDGMTRILTVIDGNGMDLIGNGVTLNAPLSVPVTFDGGLAIMARLANGPVKDLNLIFDSSLCKGGVVRLEGPCRHALLPLQRTSFAVHCLAGEVRIDRRETLAVRDTALAGTDPLILELGLGSAMLLVNITLLT